MAIEQDDVIKIIKLMDESDYDELHLEMGDLKLTIAKRGTGGLSSMKEPPAPAPVEPKRPLTPASAVADQAPHGTESVTRDKAPQAEVPVSIAGGDGLIPIQSPLLGTFYRGPKPGAPSFVEVGSRVMKNDTVCLIEVMKTFTTLKAGVEGRIARICAENAQMVEYQQTLFLVEPELGTGN
jgi:acetyl-CoA carboxylase biotin carboxyl carrier protein